MKKADSRPKRVTHDKDRGAVPETHRVVFVNKFDWLGSGPMTTVTIQMCHAMARLGYPVTVYVAGAPASDVRDVFQKRFGFELPSNLIIRVIRRGKKFAFRFHMQTFWSILLMPKCNERWSIVTRNTDFLPLLFLLKVLKGVEVFFETHSYNGHSPSSYVLNRTMLFRQRYSLLYFWEKLFVNRMSGLMCLAHPQHQLYMEDGLRAKSIVLPLGSPPSDRDVRSGVVLPELSRRRLVYVGRYVPDIDVDSMFRALQRTNGVSLLWAGIDENGKGRLHAIAKDLGVEDRVQFRSWLSHAEMRSVLLNECSVGLACYRNSFRTAMLVSPTKVFDYFSVGLPVIAPKLATIEGIVEQGRQGILYEIDSVDSLVEAIGSILSDRGLYRRMQQECIDAADRFSWQKRAMRFLSFCQECQ